MKTQKSLCLFVGIVIGLLLAVLPASAQESAPACPPPTCVAESTCWRVQYVADNVGSGYDLLDFVVTPLCSSGGASVAFGLRSGLLGASSGGDMSTDPYVGARTGVTFKVRHPDYGWSPFNAETVRFTPQTNWEQGQAELFSVPVVAGTGAGFDWSQPLDVRLTHSNGQTELLAVSVANPCADTPTAVTLVNFSVQSTIKLCSCARAVYFRWLDPSKRGCTFTTTDPCWGRVWLYNSPVGCYHMSIGWKWCGG